MTRPHLIRGFHATSRESAKGIFSEGFKPSNNDHDWLGPGIYFFQDTIEGTRNWAKNERKGGPITDLEIIGADIEYAGFVDLVEFGWGDVLTSYYEMLKKRHSKEFLEVSKKQKPYIPGESSNLAHPLDCYVIRYAVGVLNKKRDEKVKAVRGVFLEGEPLYDGSHLLSRTHIQIAVIDATAIVDYWLVEGNWDRPSLPDKV